MFRRLLSTSTTARLPPTIKQLLAAEHVADGANVRVHGWVKSVRRQKRVAFAVLSDGSQAAGLQAVFPDPEQAKSLTNGASVRLGGTLVKSIGAGQARELRVDEVEVLGECDPETYPIQKQALSTEYLREHSHLRARTDAIGSMLRLRDETMFGLQAYFKDLGFTYVHTPIITSNDCEGAGETFQVAPTSLPASASASTSTSTSTTPPPAAPFFGAPAHLTVSAQLHLEAVAASLARVYTLSPCFRAERSQTARHLAEFWMLEGEWAFVDTLGELCDVVEGAVKAVLPSSASSTSSTSPESTQSASWETLRTAPWARITYTDAIARLQQAPVPFAYAPTWGAPLQSEHERWLADALGPVFVTDYPARIKPFYMRRNDPTPNLDEEGATVACFDLLIPGLGELAGGSLREERLPLLDAALAENGLGAEEYGWYRDLRRFGGARHGGFGLGFERLISWVGGVENVRECIAMPRWAGRMML